MRFNSLNSSKILDVLGSARLFTYTLKSSLIILEFAEICFFNIGNSVDLTRLGTKYIIDLLLSRSYRVKKVTGDGVV